MPLTAADGNNRIGSDTTGNEASACGHAQRWHEVLIITMSAPTTSVPKGLNLASFGMNWFLAQVVTYQSPPDGGGIRGLIQLIILDNIMETIKSRYNLEMTPSPYEYFDLIGGTSTGGYAPLCPFLCLTLYLILSEIDRAPSRKTSHVD